MVLVCKSMRENGRECHIHHEKPKLPSSELGQKKSASCALEMKRNCSLVLVSAVMSRRSSVEYDQRRVVIL